jgi:hypothetical protein
MYPRIPWELVADTLRSAEHTLGTTVLEHQLYTNRISDAASYQRDSSSVGHKTPHTAYGTY